MFVLMHNKVLWGLQIVMGLYFIGVGVMHFVVPDGLPDLMSWMYELADELHIVAGVAEILGGLGLILPSVTKIQPQLAVFAALGLIAVMVGAIVWHIGREEYASMATNIVNILILTYVAYGRARLAPIASR